MKSEFTFLPLQTYWKLASDMKVVVKLVSDMEVVAVSTEFGVEFNCGLRLHGDHPLDVKIYDTRLPTMPETHPSVLWSCCCFQSSADTRRLSIKQPMSSRLLSCTIVERRRGAAS